MDSRLYTTIKPFMDSNYYVKCSYRYTDGAFEGFTTSLYDQDSNTKYTPKEVIEQLMNTFGITNPEAAKIYYDWWNQAVEKYKQENPDYYKSRMKESTKVLIKKLLRESTETDIHLIKYNRIIKMLEISGTESDFKTIQILKEVIRYLPILKKVFIHNETDNTMSFGTKMLFDLGWIDDVKTCMKEIEKYCKHQLGIEDDLAFNIAWYYLEPLTEHL